MAANVFNSVQVRKPSQNWFNLGHDVKLSMEFGKLIPFLCAEAIPGDYFKIRCESLVRFAPLIAPVMHQVNVHMHYFFVPNRLVWPNWEDFISPPKADSVPPAWPHFSALGANPKYGVGDYIGLPVGSNPLGDISAIPFAAYQRIFNEYYRDQNLADPVTDTLTNGANNGNFSDLNTIRTRAWMHDYFTGSLPFAQKGPPVSLPIGEFTDVPVSLNPDRLNDAGIYRVESGTFPESGALAYRRIGAPGSQIGNISLDSGSDQLVGIDPRGSWIAETSELTAEAATINDLRNAFRLQEFLEKQARGGSRYIEQIRMHFAVKSSDQRLQRPEFLGGTKNPVVISEVLQTSSSDESTPQATMAGHGIAANTGKTISYFCEEHGYIFGIMSITPLTAYQQGIPRHFLRQDMFDYAWPTFAHIGEQEVYNKELYVADDDENDDTFGYVPRYAEYRYIPSRVAGEFRDTLAFWHLGRIFGSRPHLNTTFIQCNPRNDIFAVSEAGNQNLWCHVFNSVKVRRKLPKYGTPTL